MEDQAILNLETGTKEAVALTPKTVKIEQVRIEPVGEKKNTKLVCSVKHPDREETIEISAVKYEARNKLQVTGLWVNLDEDSKIRKGSALAIFMAKIGARTPKELEGREVDTTEDEKGYLVFKAY
jgi:hypothetical protein